MILNLLENSDFIVGLSVTVAGAFSIFLGGVIQKHFKFKRVQRKDLQEKVNVLIRKISEYDLEIAKLKGDMETNISNSTEIDNLKEKIRIMESEFKKDFRQVIELLMQYVNKN
jgi:predicted RNase H-like nuclease (RuvC/YqgF family)